ncbi:MAG TPA: NADH:flavin oxidoreductase/NADH oxidase, partial [Candidatus Scatomorpha stercoravium]|nr:NADH:flavin oxidoreductase/NADH oxidase [Candidatus Scatomorpha stercoravium]
TNRYVNGGQENVTASAASEYSEEYPARELTVWEIKELVHKFGCSAGIACEADFDGVEIHAAHEYLINQFLSPLTNHRTDEYGGSLENRARFLVEIIKEVRRVIGPMKILSVRVPVSDWKEGGIDPAMGAQIAKICEDAGADMAAPPASR